MFDRQKEQLESSVTWGFVIPGNGIVVKCGYAVFKRNASRDEYPGLFCLVIPDVCAGIHTEGKHKAWTGYETGVISK